MRGMTTSPALPCSIARRRCSKCSFLRISIRRRVLVKEFDLLNLFMSNIGKIYSRDELLETIWGFDYIGDFRTVDVHIRRLREKIEKDPANPKHIMTKWGVGYYFAE